MTERSPRRTVTNRVAGGHRDRQFCHAWRTDADVRRSQAALEPLERRSEQLVVRKGLPVHDGYILRETAWTRWRRPP